ncbi:hypothetical protein BVRB_5g117020 [Beta vulgaris subsp. vulgaris]|nr:hypothetical protein BVRB_5g117020 [Beta vulgaris subsp. vulgaris]
MIYIPIFITYDLHFPFFDLLPSFIHLKNNIFPVLNPVLSPRYMNIGEEILIIFFMLYAFFFPGLFSSDFPLLAISSSKKKRSSLLPWGNLLSITKNNLVP